MSLFWILLELRMLVTTGAIKRAKLQSNRHHQHINTQLFIGWMPFLSPNQRCQRTEGNFIVPINMLIIHTYSPHQLQGWLPSRPRVRTRPRGPLLAIIDRSEGADRQSISMLCIQVGSLGAAFIICIIASSVGRQRQFETNGLTDTTL